MLRLDPGVVIGFCLLSGTMNLRKCIERKCGFPEKGSLPDNSSSSNDLYITSFKAGLFLTFYKKTLV